MIPFDKDLFLALNKLSEIAFLETPLRLIVNEYFVPVILSLILFYLWLSPPKENKKISVIAALSVGLIDLLIKVLNLIYFRSRPFVDLPQTHLLYYRPTDSSFPSNAAAVAFAISVAIFVVNRRVGTIALLIALVYSLSRVIVGVHYPSDVIAGALLGASFSFMISKVKLIDLATKMLLKILTFLKIEPTY